MLTYLMENNAKRRLAQWVFVLCLWSGSLLGGDSRMQLALFLMTHLLLVNVTEMCSLQTYSCCRLTQAALSTCFILLTTWDQETNKTKTLFNEVWKGVIKHVTLGMKLLQEVARKCVIENNNVRVLLLDIGVEYDLLKSIDTLVFDI